MKDVKQKHQQKLIEKKIKEEKENQENEYIASALKERESNWRLELFGDLLPKDGLTGIPDRATINR
jgi:hypothetical protein